MAGDDIVRYIQEADFEREVLQSAGPVVVAFWAPWSDPAVLFAPVITRAARAHANQVKTLAVNVDESRTLRGRYGIEDIVGHCDIAPGRKTDPGPAFDWPRLERLIARRR